MVYNKEYYQKNKEKYLKWQREYRKKNQDKVLENRRIYDKENRDHQLELKYKWRKNNQKKYKEEKVRQAKKYWQKIKDSESHKIKRQEQRKKYYETHKEKIKAYRKEYQQRPEVKARRAEQTRLRRKTNPQSNRKGSIDLQIAMNNVRKRDHNTCQWQGCNLTFRESPIHVHHIFPRSEYPDWELVEQYMICYCANHHGLWHRMRGDKYSEMIPARYQEDQLTTLRGRD